MPHKLCAYTKEGVTIFFYVDDIVLTFRNQMREQALKTVIQLQPRYRLTGGNDLQWFLGIEVLRVRSKRLIWVSESSQVEKIAALTQTKLSGHSLMTEDELLPFEPPRTTTSQCTFVRLARCCMPPSSRVQTLHSPLRDLRASLRIQDESTTGQQIECFYIWTRPVPSLSNWVEQTICALLVMPLTPTILVIARAAKGGIYISRMPKELGIKLDTAHLAIDCDNQQTIRLVTEDIARLKTGLRHVDVYNHWLRQEYAYHTIDVMYVESARMKAGGLTKVLVQGKLESSREQMGVVDVLEQLAKRREIERKGD